MLVVLAWDAEAVEEFGEGEWAADVADLDAVGAAFVAFGVSEVVERGDCLFHGVLVA